MLIFILLYTALIIITGVFSACFRNNSFVNRYTVPFLFSAASILLLFIILKGFILYQPEVLVLSWQLPFAEFKTGADYISLFFYDSSYDFNSLMFCIRFPLF